MCVESSLIGCFVVLFITYLYTFLGGDSKQRSWRLKLYFIVSAVYLLSAVIVSTSFDTVNNFYVSDASRDLELYKSAEAIDYEDLSIMLFSCYIDIGDNNALHGLLCQFWGYICRTHFDGVNSFVLALISVLFGILSSITLFRILSNPFPYDKAYKYTLVFSTISLFHIYSTLIIRDIIIAFFYLLCFEIIQKSFSYKRLFYLIVLMIITWGFRLYSGLFIVCFIFYFIYKYISKKKTKYFLISLFTIFIAIVGIYSMVVIQQSLDELKQYSEYSNDRATEGGMINILMGLPPGIKHVSILFLTQMMPFPPYIFFLTAKTLSHFYISTLVLVFSVWWYLVAYTFLYIFVVKKFYKRITTDEMLLLLIVLVFLLANTAQPDVRRMMPVYPIIYFYYLKWKDTAFNKKSFAITQRRIIAVYVGLLLIYTALKGGL